MSARIDPMDQLLDQAADSLRDSASRGPTEALISQTLERMAAGPATRPEGIAASGGSRTSRRWVAWAMAASVLICIGVASMIHGSSTRAFAQVIDAMQQSLGLKLQVVAQLGSEPPQRGRMELSGSKLRIEWFDGKLVAIGDLDSGRVVTLDAERKVGEMRELQQTQLAAAVNPIDQLRHAKSADAEPLGSENIDGRSMDVYRMNHPTLMGMTGGEMRIWVDQATNLPARIVVRDTDPKSEMQITLDRLDWHAAVNPADLAVEVPPGYKKGQVVLAPMEPAEPLAATVAARARLISGDRVPRAVVWGNDSQWLTAVVTEPEATPVQQVRPNELRQWIVSDAVLRWSLEIGGGASLATSADGELLATCEGREIQIRAAADGEVRQTMVAKWPLPALALSGDGKWLATGVADWQAQRGGVAPAGGIELWDVASGMLVRTLASDQAITFVAISPDGRWIASADSNGSVKLWRTSDGMLVQIFESQSRAAFSPDSQLVAVTVYQSVGNAMRTGVEIYDLQGFDLQHSLTTNEKCQLLCLDFSPDAKSIAAGSWEGTLYRWNLKGRSQPTRTEAIGSGIHAARFSPDGKMLATGSEDGALQIWKTE